MFYILILVHVLCVVHTKAFPQRSRGYDDYNTYHGSYVYPVEHAYTPDGQLRHYRNDYIPFTQDPVHHPPLDSRKTINGPPVYNNPYEMQHNHWYSTYQSHYDPHYHHEAGKNFHRAKEPGEVTIEYRTMAHRPFVPTDTEISEANPVMVTASPRNGYPYEPTIEVSTTEIDKANGNSKTKHVNPLPYKKYPLAPTRHFGSVLKTKLPIIKQKYEDYDPPLVVGKLIREEPRDWGDYDTPMVVETLVKKHGHHSIDKSKPPYSRDSGISKVNENLRADYEDYDSPVVVEALTKKKPITHVKNKVDSKEDPMKTTQLYKDSKKPHEDYDYDAPMVVEALVKKHGHADYPVHKKKPAYSSHSGISNVKSYVKEDMRTDQDYDSPVVVEALTKKRPIAHVKNAINSKVDPMKENQLMDKDPVKPHKDYEYDVPMVVEALVKKHGHGDYPIDERKSSLASDSNLSKVKNNKGIKIMTHEEDYDSPLVVEALTKKKPVISKVGAINQKPLLSKESVKPSKEDYYDTPMVVESLVKKHGSLTDKGKPLYWSDSASSKVNNYAEDYDSPKVVEALIKKQPVASDKFVNSKIEDYDSPLVAEALTKKKPVISKVGAINQKPLLSKESVEPSEEDYYDAPMVVESLVKKHGGLTDKGSKSHEKYEKPLVVEALTKKRPVSKDDYDSPVVVEALIKKDHIHHKPKGKGKRGNGHLEHIVYTGKGKVRRTYFVDIHERPNDKFASKENFLNKVHAHDNSGHLEYDSNGDGTSGQKFSTEMEPQNKRQGYSKDYFGKPVEDSINNDKSYGGIKSPIVEAIAPAAIAPYMDTLNLGTGSEDLDLINIGKSDGLEIERFDESGSGMDLDERSRSPGNPRSFLPLDTTNIWSFMGRIQDQERRKFKRCLTPKNETGNCMPFQICSVPNVAGSIEELFKNVCVIDEVFIGVCCPEFPVETVRVNWEPSVRPDDEVFNVRTTQIPRECGKLPSFGSKDPTWPWMAPLISSSSEKVFCGGVLISENYVLTAAHCTTRIPRNRILVRLGHPDSAHLQRIDFAVVEIKRHAGYNPRTMHNDIALLKLSRKVRLGDFRRLICLPSEDVEDYVGETATLLRWKGILGGKSDVENLVIISKQECQNRLGTAIGDSVCAEPRVEDSMCNADSGAPFVIGKDGRFFIIGVLTWNRNDCDRRYPSVFTRISAYRNWIQTHAS